LWVQVQVKSAQTCTEPNHGQSSEEAQGQSSEEAQAV